MKLHHELEASLGDKRNLRPISVHEEFKANLGYKMRSKLDIHWHKILATECSSVVFSHWQILDLRFIDFCVKSGEKGVKTWQ